MMRHMIALASLAILYGLAWHNRTSRELDRAQEADTKRDENRPRDRSVS